MRASGVGSKAGVELGTFGGRSWVACPFHKGYLRMQAWHAARADACACHVRCAAGLRGVAWCAGAGEEVEAPSTPERSEAWDDILAGPLTFPCPEDLMQAVVAQLEEEDVQRLTRAADGLSSYEAAYDAAAHSKPPGRVSLSHARSHTQQPCGAGAQQINCTWTSQALCSEMCLQQAACSCHHGVT